MVSRTGVVRGDGPALQIVSRIEEVCPDRKELSAALAAIEETGTDTDRRFLAMMGDPEYDQYSLARLVAEAGTSPMRVMRRFLEGCALLNRLEAGVEAARNMPKIVRELQREAFGRSILCRPCNGTGKITKNSNYITATEPCQPCEGTGRKIVHSKHKQFAIEQLLEINEMKPKKGPLVQVQQNTVNVAGRNGFENLLKGVDEALYPRKVTEIAPTEAVLVEK